MNLSVKASQRNIDFVTSVATVRHATIQHGNVLLVMF